MSELINIQRWFTSIIVKPGRLYDKISRADEFYHLNYANVIIASEGLSAPDKIGIYAGGYVQRLLECMAAEFPALQHLLGEDLFDTFVRAYLVNRPSTSPDLFDLGQNFPGFLKESQAIANIADTTNPILLDIPVELAQLERAIAEASRCRGLEQQETGDLGNEQMFWAFAMAGYQTSPALKLLQLQFSLIDFVRHVSHKQEVSTPEQKPCFVAISRKNYVIKMQELEQWQWHFLQALQASKDCLTAVNATSDICLVSSDTLMADMLLWIPLALDAGYIFPTQVSFS